MQKSFFIISILVAEVASGQQPASTVWLALRVPVTINNKWQVINDAGYRTMGYSTSAWQYLYRTGIKYFISNEWSVAAGIAFFYTRTSVEKLNHEFGKEFRLWQELNYKHDFKGRFTLQNRFRTEERFFAATKTKKEYNAFRLRYRISGTQKLSDKWSLQAGDEYMEQEAAGNFSFNQNRLMFYAIYDANATTQFQGGYMWSLLPSSSLHILTISLQKSFSLHADKKHS